MTQRARCAGGTLCVHPQETQCCSCAFCRCVDPLTCVLDSVLLVRSAISCALRSESLCCFGWHWWQGRPKGEAF